MVVDRMVLAVFEALETIDDDRALGRCSLPHSHVEEHAVAAEAGDLTIDRFRRTPDVPGDLPGAHAADQAHEEPAGDVSSLEPVVGGEGLSREGHTACPALRTRDTQAVGRAAVVAAADEAPPLVEVIVELAVGIGAVGRGPPAVVLDVSHGPGPLPVRGHEQSSRHNLREWMPVA